MYIARRNTAGLLLSMMLAAFFAGLVLLALQAYNAEPAEAHRLGEKAVRNGKIHYASGSDFDFHDARRWAVGQWNRLEPIDIVRDTRSTDMDLRFQQYPGESGKYKEVDGYYDYRPPDVDQIMFNRRLWKNPGFSLNKTERARVAVHELGHALNLDHPRKTRYWKRRSIMYSDSKNVSFRSFQRHDRKDYNRYW